MSQRSSNVVLIRAMSALVPWGRGGGVGSSQCGSLFRRLVEKDER